MVTKLTGHTDSVVCVGFSASPVRGRACTSCLPPSRSCPVHRASANQFIAALKARMANLSLREAWTAACAFGSVSARSRTARGSSSPTSRGRTRSLCITLPPSWSPALFKSPVADERPLALPVHDVAPQGRRPRRRWRRLDRLDVAACVPPAAAGRLDCTDLAFILDGAHSAIRQHDAGLCRSHRLGVGRRMDARWCAR